MADPQGVTVNPDEITAAQVALRQYADSTAYGRFVSDDECRRIATVVVTAVESFRNAATI